MPRLLILSASVGAGHVRAGQALERAAHQILPQAEITHLDVLTLTNAAFRRVYGRGYIDLVNRAPHALGYFYDFLDRPSPSGVSRTDRLIHIAERSNLRPLVRYLLESDWDLAISTHFLPAKVIAALRRTRRLHQPHVTVTTDFDTHRLWINQPCEHYFTATTEGARYLSSFGVAASEVTAVGIPIDPSFSSQKDPEELRRKHGVTGERPLILQLAGGFGVGPVDAIYKALLEIDRPLDVIVVCGRNEAAKRRLESVSIPCRHRSRVICNTTEMDDLMAIADVVVSKPGGLTTSEALASGAVMAIVNPIPGQESRNSDYLLENGAAIKINNIATLSFKLEDLLADAPRRAQMRSNALALARPRAALTVLERTLSLCGGRLSVAGTPKEMLNRAGSL